MNKTMVAATLPGLEEYWCFGSGQALGPAQAPSENFRTVPGQVPGPAQTRSTQGCRQGQRQRRYCWGKLLRRRQRLWQSPRQIPQQGQGRRHEGQRQEQRGRWQVALSRARVSRSPRTGSQLLSDTTSSRRCDQAGAAGTEAREQARRAGGVAQPSQSKARNGCCGTRGSGCCSPSRQEQQRVLVIPPSHRQCQWRESGEWSSIYRPSRTTA